MRYLLAMVFGPMFFASAIAQAAVPQATSTADSCRYWTGSPSEGGVEISATGERITTASSTKGQISAITLTISSPKPLRTAPQASAKASLFLIIPGSYVARRTEKEPDKYLDGRYRSIGRGAADGKTIRILNVTAHYGELNSDRYDINPEDWADLRISESLVTNIDSAALKLFELQVNSGFSAPVPVGIASKDFNSCINSITNITYTQAPGPLTTKAVVKLRSTEFSIADIMPDFRARLTPGKPSFPSTVDLDIQVTSEGRALQCQVQPNLRLEQFQDVKGKICQQAIRHLRFVPATDRDERPVPDTLMVTLRFKMPCDPKIEKCSV
jgi:hypothetical protein